MKSKIFVMFLVVVLIFAFSLPVKAVTINDLLSQINSLQNQVSNLQKQLSAMAISAVDSVLTTTESYKVDNSIVTDESVCTRTTPSWIKVLSPNGDEVYQAGQQITVKWGNCNIPASIKNVSILLKYYSNSGQLITIGGLVEHTINDGFEVVTLPSSLPNMAGVSWGKNFKISVGAADSHNNILGLDESDNLFTINPVNPCGTSPSWIKVLSPNGDEVYQAGQQITVKWDSCNIPATFNNVGVMLKYYDNSGSQVLLISGLAEHTVNDGTEIVTLPSSLPNMAGVSWGKNFKISVSAATPSGIYLGSDESDNLFTINDPNPCTSSTPSWIKVLSPNGGEVYKTGQQMIVKWDSCNIPANNSNVAISLTSTQTPVIMGLAVVTQNDGIEAITIPNYTGIAFGNYFKVSVGTVDSNNISLGLDYSDDLFTINSGSNKPTTLPSDVSSSQNVFSRNLQIGSKGEEVKAFQEILLKRGFLSKEAKIDGVFGKVTFEAVKNYQKANGLEPVGNIGPKTLKKLTEEKL